MKKPAIASVIFISAFDSCLCHSPIPPTDELLKLKMTEGVLILLNTDKNVYASLFDFVEPWKIDILDFLNENYMYDLSMEEMASYTGRGYLLAERKG